MRMSDWSSDVCSSDLGPMSLHLWINDGRMAIFFLRVGLEIKREFMDGRLASWSQRRLPFVAAASGMIVPAAFYLLFPAESHGPEKGWAIPAARDLAFAIGALPLLGKRAQTSLNLLLITLPLVAPTGAL